MCRSVRWSTAEPKAKGGGKDEVAEDDDDDDDDASVESASTKKSASNKGSKKSGSKKSGSQVKAFVTCHVPLECMPSRIQARSSDRDAKCLYQLTTEHP